MQLLRSQFLVFRVDSPSKLLPIFNKSLTKRDLANDVAYPQLAILIDAETIHKNAISLGIAVHQDWIINPGSRV